MANEITNLFRFAEITVGFSQTQAFRLRAEDELLLDTFDPVPSRYHRMATRPWGRGLFYVSPEVDLSYLDRDGKQDLAESRPQPRAAHLEVFRDHVVLGNVVFNGRHRTRVLASDLRKFHDFDVRRHSEAAYYDVTARTAANERTEGVTGLSNLRDMCLVFTPMDIFAMRYIGLPQVYNMDVLVSDVGNCFPYSLVRYQNFHAFISDSGFHLLQPDGSVVRIAVELEDYFFDQLTEDNFWRYQTWVYLDRRRKEAWWCFQSKDAENGTFDKAVIFQFETQQCFAASLANIHSQVSAPVSTDPNAIEDLTEAFTAYEGNFLDLDGDMEQVQQTLFGSADNVLLRNAEDEDEELVEEDRPFAESPDIYADTPGRVLELGPLFLDASQQVDENGFDIYIAAREHFDDPIVWEHASVWTQQLKNGYVGTQRRSARIFRLKIEPAGGEVRNAAINHWGEILRVSTSNK